MKKSALLISIMVLIATFCLANISNASEEKVGSLTHSAILATGSFLEQGFEFTSGHWYSESRSFQKMTIGGRITVIMTADETGKKIKSLFASMPPDQKAAKDLIKTSLVYVASARGANVNDALDVERMFLFSFWPEKVMKYWGTNSDLAFGMYGIAVTMENGGGNINIEIQ
ncbi:MAG: hypothetical protein WC831_01210 [Parcubacteria group bacterium]|jgi:hypothetical protein